MAYHITPNLLERVASESSLSVDEREEVLKVAKGLEPGKKSWLHFLEIFLLSFGALSIVAGAIFFFAYNWSELHRLGKVATALILFVLSVSVTTRMKSDTLPWKITAMTTAVLIGVVMALLGQIYQTGADAWELFAWWTLLALPFAFIIRFAPLWFFLVLIGQTAFSLFCAQRLGVEWLWIYGLPLTLLFVVLSLQKSNLSSAIQGWFRVLVGSVVSIWYTSILTYFIFLNWEYAHWVTSGSYEEVLLWFIPISGIAFFIWVYTYYLSRREGKLVLAFTTAGIGWNIFFLLSNNIIGWETMYESYFLVTVVMLALITWGVISIIKRCDAVWEEVDNG